MSKSVESGSVVGINGYSAENGSAGKNLIGHVQRLGELQSVPDVFAYFNRFKRTFDPGLLTATFQRAWDIRGARDNQMIVVTPAPFTPSDIEEVMNNGRTFGFMPPGYDSADAQPQLAKMLGLSMEGPRTLAGENFFGALTNTNPVGWYSCEATPLPPNTDLTRAQLEKLFADQGLMGMDLPHYLDASANSKDGENGKLFEQHRTTHARLPGSLTPDGNIIHANAPVGTIIIYETIAPKSHYTGHGGRSIADYGL